MVHIMCVACEGVEDEECNNITMNLTFHRLKIKFMYGTRQLRQQEGFEN